MEHDSDSDGVFLLSLYTVHFHSFNIQSVGLTKQKETTYITKFAFVDFLSTEQTHNFKLAYGTNLRIVFLFSFQNISS